MNEKISSLKGKKAKKIQNHGIGSYQFNDLTNSSLFDNVLYKKIKLQTGSRLYIKAN